MDQATTVATVEAFNAAWGAHDLDATLALVTDDAVFESTGPAPAGIRHVGRAALRDAWAPIFDDTSTVFTVETAFAAGDRYVQTWHYEWGDGHVRGVDLFLVRDALVAEKLSYVKG